MGQLQKVYAELLSFSTNRMTDLETLLDFIQSATNELQWLNEKEEIEVTRDWSDIKLDVRGVEKYFEVIINLNICCSFSFKYICLNAAKIWKWR